LSAEVIAASNQTNLSVSRLTTGASNSVAISFDEVGPGEGAVFALLHTSPERFVLLRGAIAGMHDAPQDRGRVRHPFNPLPAQIPTSFKAVGRVAFVLTFAIGALLVLLSAFSSRLAPIWGPHLGPFMSVIEGVSDVIYAILAFIVLAQTRRQFPEDLALPELTD
jgi:hypothetical protein